MFWSPSPLQPRSCRPSVAGQYGGPGSICGAFGGIRFSPPRLFIVGQAGRSGGRNSVAVRTTPSRSADLSRRVQRAPSVLRRRAALHRGIGAAALPAAASHPRSAASDNQGVKRKIRTFKVQGDEPPAARTDGRVTGGSQSDRGRFQTSTTRLLDASTGTNSFDAMYRSKGGRLPPPPPPPSRPDPTGHATDAQLQDVGPSPRFNAS